MKLTVINTGSSGNCYLLEENGEVLILDCGVSFADIKKALGFNLMKVSGCMITHVHTDHSKSRKDFESAGIPLFTPYDKGKIKDNAQLGNFKLQAFLVPHNDTTNYGVIISHTNGQRMLYLTDFEYCRYTFKNMGINHYLIECNYQDEYLDVNAPNYEHKRAGHCSLNTCRDLIKANANDAMQNVIICHMGIGSCDPLHCVDEIAKELPTTVNVDYARPKEIYELTNNRLPFDWG